MNIAKKSKLSTKSIRPHIEVGSGRDGDDEYTIVADMIGRTFTIKNKNDEVVAQVAKTTKAMIQTAVLGSGSESTIDIAPGVDCSIILAIVFGLGQVGAHFVKDAANSYVVEPLKDSLVESAIEKVVDAQTDVSNGSDDDEEDGENSSEGEEENHGDDSDHTSEHKSEDVN